MTPDERDNEHQKLIANWFNTLATGWIVAGFLVPGFQWIYGLLPQTTDWALPATLGSICVLIGIFIHLCGHIVLWRLK